MQGLTLAIAIIFSLLVLTLRPTYALAALLTCLLWYPSYLVISIGTIDISVARIVVGILFLRCWCDEQIRIGFRWSGLDTWVVLSMAVYVGVFCVTRPLSYVVENRGGFLLDTWFTYITARFIVTDQQKLTSILKFISVVLVPLAVLGIVESVTGWQPFVPLLRFCPWFTKTIFDSYEARWGLVRAVGPFHHPILFGCGLAIFLPLVYYLRHGKDHWRVLAYIISGVVLVGALSSMSSGPWVMVIVVIICLAMERYKYLVKPLLIFLVLSCIIIGVISNRPFYHVIASYANPLGGAGWHRAVLIDFAIERFDEWWLVGYGGRDPGWWTYSTGPHTDVTNEFILAGVRYGILGIIALCGVLITAFRGLLRAYNKTVDPELKSLYWSLSCILVSVTVTWISASWGGNSVPILYCLLGVIGSISNLAPERSGNLKQSFSPGSNSRQVMPRIKLNT